MFDLIIFFRLSTYQFCNDFLLFFTQSIEIIYIEFCFNATAQHIRYGNAFCSTEFDGGAAQKGELSRMDC